MFILHCITLDCIVRLIFILLSNYTCMLINCPLCIDLDITGLVHTSYVMQTYNIIYTCRCSHTMLEAQLIFVLMFDCRIQQQEMFFWQKVSCAKFQILDLCENCVKMKSTTIQPLTPNVLSVGWHQRVLATTSTQQLVMFGVMECYSGNYSTQQKYLMIT